MIPGDRILARRLRIGARERLKESGRKRKRRSWGWRSGNIRVLEPLVMPAAVGLVVFNGWNLSLLLWAAWAWTLLTYLLLPGRVQIALADEESLALGTLLPLPEKKLHDVMLRRVWPVPARTFADWVMVFAVIEGMRGDAQVGDAVWILLAAVTQAVLPTAWGVLAVAVLPRFPWSLVGPWLGLLGVGLMVLRERLQRLIEKMGDFLGSVIEQAPPAMISRLAEQAAGGSPAAWGWLTAVLLAAAMIGWLGYRLSVVRFLRDRSVEPVAWPLDLAACWPRLEDPEAIRTASRVLYAEAGAEFAASGRAERWFAARLGNRGRQALDLADYHGWSWSRCGWVGIGFGVASVVASHFGWQVSSVIISILGALFLMPMTGGNWQGLADVGAHRGPALAVANFPLSLACIAWTVVLVNVVRITASFPVLLLLAWGPAESMADTLWWATIALVLGVVLQPLVIMSKIEAVVRRVRARWWYRPVRLLTLLGMVGTGIAVVATCLIGGPAWAWVMPPFAAYSAWLLQRCLRRLERGACELRSGSRVS